MKIDYEESFYYFMYLAIPIKSKILDVSREFRQHRSFLIWSDTGEAEWCKINDFVVVHSKQCEYCVARFRKWNWTEITFCSSGEAADDLHWKKSLYFLRKKIKPALIIFLQDSQQILLNSH